MKNTKRILVCLLAMVFCFTSLGITAFAADVPGLFDPELVGKDDGGFGKPLFSTVTVTNPVLGDTQTTEQKTVTLTKAQKKKLNNLKSLSKPTLKAITAGENVGELVLAVKSKVKNATGYEFYRSTKQKSGFKRVAKVTTLSTTVAGHNGTYYFKVRAYLKKPNGKTLYSKYTAVKKVTAQVKVAKATYNKTLDVSGLLGDVMLTQVMSNPEMIMAKFQTIDLKKVGGAAFSTANFSYSKTAGANNHWQYMLRAKDAKNAENLAVVTEKIAKNPNINTNEFMEIFQQFVGVDTIATKVLAKVTEKLKESGLDLTTLDINKVLNDPNSILAPVNTLRTDLEKRKILQYKKGTNKSPLYPFKGLMIGIPQTLEYLGGLDSLLAETSTLADLHKESEFLTTYKNLQRGDMLLCEGCDKNVAIVVLGYYVGGKLVK